ncbi:unnamed protein product [Auanema sp. JU1783]|nr:unnamed protein product [Auanema sp. JU1783]
MYAFNSRNGLPYPSVSTVGPAQNLRNVYKCRSYNHGATMPIHGLQKILTTRSNNRVLWGALMILTIGATVYFTVVMVNEYSHYETTTHISVLQNNSLLMPSIHICPKNPEYFDYKTVYQDMNDRVGNLTKEQQKNLLKYFVAGSGLQNSGLESLSKQQIREAGEQYLLWLGNRTLIELFDFVFNKHGVKCENILKKCIMSGVEFDCCKAFRPHYVILRGRCIRLDPIEQKGTSESDKLRLEFIQPDSKLISRESQRQFVFYMGDIYPEIYFIPRFYHNIIAFGELEMRARLVQMLHRNETCISSSISRGRSTCFLNNWILENLVEPLNCTLPYLDTLYVSRGLSVCHPSQIIEIYDNLMVATNVRHRCNLNCDRWDYIYRYSEKNAIQREDNYVMDIFFTDLMYEVYSEIKMVTFTGFVSQIGGQAVLFIGTSVISLIFIVEFMLNSLYNYIRKKMRK